MDSEKQTGGGIRHISRTTYRNHPRKRVARCTDMSLENVIKHGAQLRREKRTCLRADRPGLNIIAENDSSVKTHSSKKIHQPPCSPSNCSTYKALVSPSRDHTSRATSPSYITRPCSPRSYTPSSTCKRKKTSRCPLRLAELAEPTKRQCISTWRNKNHTLPDHMLERLKQQVMNQKVLADIPDAINCFKYHKNRVTSPNKRSDTQCRKPMKIQAQEMDHIKLMTAVLCNRVAGRLMQPMNIFLSDELEKVSHIVATEIRKLTPNQRLRIDYVHNREIMKEMSGKVALWIADILGNARYKLLEDEVRAKKTKENKLGKEGNLVTLIDQYVRLQADMLPDLEEEEGPALDAIDTIVNNVLNNCVPKSDSDSYEYKSPINEFNKESVPATNDSNIFDGVILDKESKDDLNHIPVDGNDTEFSNEPTISNKDSLKNMLDVNGVYEMPEHLNDENSGDDLNSNYDSTVDQSDADDDTKNLVDGDEDVNVSDANDTLEESLDDRKKVKFSQVIDADETGRAGESPGTGTNKPGETGTDEPGGTRRDEPGRTKTSGPGRTRTDEPARTGTDTPGGTKTDKPDRRVICNESLEMWPRYSLSATRIKNDIFFQDPNPSILSVADESWPDDFLIPTLKPSESVSKSITSLGEIKEVDEDDHDYNQRSGGQLKVFKDGKYIYNNKHGRDKRIFSSELCEQDENSTITTSDNINTDGTTPASYSTSQKNDRNDETYISEVMHSKEQWSSTDLPGKISPSKLLGELKTLIDSERAVQIKEKEISKETYEYSTTSNSDSFKDSGKGDHINDNQKAQQEDNDKYKNPILVAFREKLRNESKPKFDYRVHPQTAPAWALKNPSEDSVILTEKTRRLGSCDFRRWCKDMENTLDNLEQWHSWINITCNKLLNLKQHTVTNNMFAQHNRKLDLKEWIKLKNNIDKDAILWRKLSHRTRAVLTSHYDPSKEKLEKKSKLPISKQKISIKQSVVDVMFAIEGLSMWLHRSIVSTEHVVRCNCKKPEFSQVPKKPRKNKQTSNFFYF